MEVVTLLQVGDIHYPDHDRPDADVKDDALPEPLVKTATASELKASTRALLEAISANPSALLAFTGDLTSKGDLGGYATCVEYLDRAFWLSDKSRWDDSHLHVVPGNHDVNRDEATAAPHGDLFHKFLPLTAAWAAHDLAIIATEHVRSTSVGSALSLIRAYALNSCLGCRERRQLPDSVRAAVLRTMGELGVDGAAATDAVELAASELAEEVDAPAYSEEHINEVCQSIRATEEPSLAVLIAHHNLLQQAQPRFDLYTDVINGGMVRSRLTSLDVPILYLHGHIHADPIECVTQVAPDTGQLICISAPEFRAGFNQIDVSFAHDGTPIGCVVKRYRVRLSGGTSIETPVRIRFDAYDFPVSDLAARVAALLLADPDCSALLQVTARLEADGLMVDDQDVADALEEAEWFGLVEIINRERPRRNWRLRVVMRP